MVEGIDVPLNIGLIKPKTTSPGEPQDGQIKRVTWLDIYPIKKKELKILGSKFDELREEAALTASTPDVVRRLNGLAYQEGINPRESQAWLAIKDWIFEQEIINKDNSTGHLVDARLADKTMALRRDEARMDQKFDRWNGTQKGIYAGNIFPMPTSFLDYEVTSNHREDELRFQKLDPVEKPGDFENFIATRLVQIGRVKTGPVVFVDFGGVQSITSLRLAKHFEDEIKQGKMVFIVTNLAADKSTIQKFIHKSRYENQEKRFFLDSMDLVHYVQADAEELSNMTIQIPTGDNITLKGNVDIIHEADAITPHGYLNDRDFAYLGQMLSEQGILATMRNQIDGAISLDSDLQFVNRMDTVYFTQQHGYKSSSRDVPKIKKPDSRKYWSDEKQKRAYQNLTEGLGLINVDALPLSNGRAIQLNYSFFVKPAAPPLHFTDRFNREYEIPINTEARAAWLKTYTAMELEEAWKKEPYPETSTE